MLDELIVSNLGVIEHASIEPGLGFVVVTGETGTGKTLLLGALRLLLGAQASASHVGPFESEARVDGRFVVDGEETGAARRVVAAGRSKAYLDGTVAPAGALRDRLAGHVEIVGQHDQLALTSSAGVRRLLDAGVKVSVRQGYADAWASYAAIRKEADVLGADSRSLERELDMARFQAAEIEEAGFRPGDDEELAVTAARLRNAEGLMEGLGTVDGILGTDDGVVDQLSAGVAELHRLARIDSSLAPLAEQATEAAALVADLQTSVATEAGSIEHDPGALQQVERRLALLGDLRRKYGDNLDEVLAYGLAAAERVQQLERLRADAATIDERLDEAHDALVLAGAALTSARTSAGARLAKDAIGHLTELGFQEPIIQLDINPAEPGPHGADTVGLRFASDSALEPGPVSRVASGGELSRIVLALRLAAGLDDVPIVAFDEVDAGVGGATALALGEKLAALAVGRQVLCVTHLPQVAAFGDTHFVVSREGNAASVRRVEGDERVEELSRMLSGMPESTEARAHAAELIARAAQP